MQTAGPVLPRVGAMAQRQKHIPRTCKAGVDPRVKKSLKGCGGAVRALNPSIWEAEFKANLVYVVSSRTVKAMWTVQRDPVSKQQNK